ncbi:spore germination protein [Lysinibacillus telephonicus]|uniref:spore germination protein n=1 Tax=Lysinibacillus telephonicus TaxID=1714840 RepID=UPI0031FC053A
MFDNQSKQHQQLEQNSLLKKKSIDPNLESTIEILKTIYSIPLNSDIKIRNILIGGLNKKASIIYISTISDSKIIEKQVIEPLLSNNDDSKDIENIVSAQSIKTFEKIEDVLSEINKGNEALLVDGYSEAFLIGSSNFQGRAIEKTENEVVLKGPKEAFNEKGSTNISLIRKKIKSENLVVEVITVSQTSKNELYIVYKKDLVNNELLNTIKEKVNSIEVDSIQNLSLMEQYIEERKNSIFPTILYTERPDRAASFIEDGFIVLLMENSPSSLVLPATFWSFFHTSEDYYLRFLYGNFIRILRLLALLITLFIHFMRLSDIFNSVF